MSSASFVAHFRNLVQAQPDRVACVFLNDGQAETARLTYGELDLAARSLAAEMQKSGHQGDRALILLPSSLEFVCAVLACFYAGRIGVPAFPFHKRWKSRLQRIMENAMPTIALTGSEAVKSFEKLDQPNGLIQIPVSIGAGATCDPGNWRDPNVNLDSLALLQYTSGSTDVPKGVLLSHGNLLANASAIAKSCEHTSESHFVGWMPLFHDMGLIGNVLQPLYLGSQSILMPPSAFLGRPSQWLQTISRFRAHTSGGPNFCYLHCLRNVNESECQGLDLSSWMIAFNGSEPVAFKTLEAFADRFVAHGFNPSAFYPCYGLAEATLSVTGGRASEHLMVGPSPYVGDHKLVGCGKPSPDCRVVIVDPRTEKVCVDGDVGEIWVAGPQVAAGYWNDSEKTYETFRARVGDDSHYLRTGDLGFLHAGNLFVAGRLKDIIIVRGQNIYPQDLEHTVLQNLQLDPFLRTAVVGVPSDTGERLVILQEVDHRSSKDILQNLAHSLRQALVQKHRVGPDTIAFVRRGSLPITTSGKIRRRDAAEAFMNGLLHTLLLQTWGDNFSDHVTSIEPTNVANDGRHSLPNVEAWLRTTLGRHLKVSVETMDLEASAPSLGIDSLGCVRLQHQIEQKWGVLISITLLLEGQPLARIAQAIATTRPPTNVAAELPTQTGIEYKETGAPATPGEKAIWYLHQIDPDRHAFNISFAIRLPLHCLVEHTQVLLETILDRHPALRTRFCMYEGELIRVESAQPHFKLEESNVEGSLKKHMAVEASRPFDLGGDLPCRAKVFRSQDEEKAALLITVHHIAVDFWSLTILAEELAEALSNNVATEGIWESVGPSTDFPSSETDSLSALHYWRRRMLSPPPRLRLPMRQSNTSQAFQYGVIEYFEFNNTLCRALGTLAGQNNTTLFTLLMAGFQLLLHEISGQIDLIVGTPLNGRGSAGVAREIGYLVNPVAIRSRWKPEWPFEYYLRRTKREIVRALRHQSLPFATLVKELNLPRKSNRQPLFDTVFAFYQSPSGKVEELASLALGRDDIEVSIGDLTFMSLPPEKPSTLYDLELSMASTNGRLFGALKFRLDSIDAGIRRSWINRFEELLNKICSQPDSLLSQLAPLSETRARLPITTLQPHSFDCPHVLFEKQVSRDPAKVAIIQGKTIWNYGTLNTRANELAHELICKKQNGLNTIAILLPPGPWQIASLLGTLKVGATFVGLNPNHPAQRIGEILEELRPGYIVTDRPSLAHLVAEGVDLPDVILLPITSAVNGQFNPNLTIDADRAAYIAFTSGSTGRPKGIIQTHGNLTQFLEWQCRTFNLGTSKIMAQLSPITFDVSYCEIFGALCFGAAVCIPQFITELSPERFGNWLKSNHVTTIQIVPSILKQILSEEDIKECHDLENVIFVGEGVPVDVASALLRSFPNAPKFYNIYGPTEVIAATCQQITNVEQAEGFVSVGTPIDGREILIQDEYGNACPPGQTGEIGIISPHLSPGYFKSEAETRRRFIRTVDGAKIMYRTGDLGTSLSNGEIQFRGRLDNQVKIHGIRVELEEIENAIRQCEGVHDCAVRLENTTLRGPKLSAFIEAAGTLDVRQVISHVRTRLPSVMLPSSLLQVSALPRNDHGKIDRQALALLQTEVLSPTIENDDLGHGELEVELTALWQELLSLDKIAHNDVFFSLGGHSLLAIRMINRVQARFGVEIAVGQFLENPTIIGCARLIRAARETGETRASEITNLIHAVESMPEEMVAQLLSNKMRIDEGR